MAEQAKYSIYTAPGDGIKTVWDFNFAGAAGTPGYISRDHIVAYRTNRVSKVIVTLVPEWVGPNTLRITPAVPVTDDITIKRITPKVSPLVDYTSGSLLNEKNLDLSNRQAVYAVAELVDAAAGNGDGSLTESVAFEALDKANIAGTKSDSALASVAAFIVNLATSAGSKLVKWAQLGTLVARTIESKLREHISVEDFGAVGDGVADDSDAIQAAFTSGAVTGRVPVFNHAVYRVTKSIDCKGLPLQGKDRLYSKLLCQLATGQRVFTNVGQVVNRLMFEATGGGRPDAFAIDGYKRYISSLYFKGMGDCICSTAIMVTTVIRECEVIDCTSAWSDKLQDGTNAHTTVWFSGNNVLYSTRAFDIKTENAGMIVRGNVFEDLAEIYNGYGKQLFGAHWSDNWVEQMARNCTLYVNVFDGGANTYTNNSLRKGSYTITDVAKWLPTQYAGTGAGGGAGGLVMDQSGVRLARLDGNGIILTTDGIKCSALEANFQNAFDFTLETQGSNASNAYRGADFVFKGGAGSYGQRRGAVRPFTTGTMQLGDSSYRWATTYTNNIVLLPGAEVTPANNGEVTFELTSNTVVKLRVKGSDGIIRSGVINLV